MPAGGLSWYACRMARPNTPPSRKVAVPRFWYSLIRWLLLTLPVLAILLGCGQLALWLAQPPVGATYRSGLSADYGPWTFTVIQPVDPQMVNEVLQDQGRAGQTPLASAILPSATPTETATATASSTRTATPRQPTPVPPTATSTVTSTSTRPPPPPATRTSTATSPITSTGTEPPPPTDTPILPPRPDTPTPTA